MTWNQSVEELRKAENAKPKPPVQEKPKPKPSPDPGKIHKASFGTLGDLFPKKVQ